jgi:hypothetical protein
MVVFIRGDMGQENFGNEDDDDIYIHQDLAGLHNMHK